MPGNKRKKFTRMRGTQTHGWGSKKKHRGAGNRGGRGKAGSGKRADQKKPSRWKAQPVTGRYGFTPIRQHKSRPINIAEIEDRLPTWEAHERITKEGDAYRIDLKALGYTKLLSQGSCSQKLHLTVPAASAKAIEKITAAGGSVNQ